MVCYLIFKSLVRKLAGNKISDKDAEEILRDIEKEVGHNMNLIKAVVDLEGAGLAKRLKKKKKKTEAKKEIVSEATAAVA